MAKAKHIDEDEAIKIAEAMARDPDLKPSTRLRALEQVERFRRLKLAAVPAEEADDGAPDPMSDLDELSVRRVRRGARDGR